MNSWLTVESAPMQQWCLLWLVTEDPQYSGVVMGQPTLYEPGKFWDGHCYRPMSWVSHWMPLPESPPKPWRRPEPTERRDSPDSRSEDARE